MKSTCASEGVIRKPAVKDGEPVRKVVDRRLDALARGRYKRKPWMWDTEFGRFVADVTPRGIVDHLAENPRLSVTTSSVYGWISGRNFPSPRRARALVKMSTGRLTLETIYRHPFEVQRMRRERKAAMPSRRLTGRNGPKGSCGSNTKAG
jgi:hypothetical protein